MEALLQYCWKHRIFPTPTFTAADGREIEVNGRWYIAKAIPLERGAALADSRGKKGKRAEAQDSEEVSVLFFEDITSLKDLQDEHRKSKPVVAIISVDNYDETVGNNRESEKTIISAQIDKLLENYFSQKNAVLRKISGDKFIVYNVEKGEKAIAAGTIQLVIDKMLEEKKGEVDYIHGVDVTIDLGKKEGNLGLVLPDVSKDNFFSDMMKDGAYPRKTFSIGHANEKRYYMEARRIK